MLPSQILADQAYGLSYLYKMTLLTIFKKYGIIISIRLWIGGTRPMKGVRFSQASHASRIRQKLKGWNDETLHVVRDLGSRVGSWGSDHRLGGERCTQPDDTFGQHHTGAARCARCDLQGSKAPVARCQRRLRQAVRQDLRRCDLPKGLRRSCGAGVQGRQRLLRRDVAVLQDGTRSRPRCQRRRGRLQTSD